MTTRTYTLLTLFMLFACSLQGHPIHEAAKNKAYQEVARHLANGVAVDIRDDDKNTPLHYAASQEHNADVIQLLLSYHAYHNAHNLSWHTPLYLAARNGSPDNIIPLIQADAWSKEQDTQNELVLEHKDTSTLQKDWSYYTQALAVRQNNADRCQLPFVEWGIFRPQDISPKVISDVSHMLAQTLPELLSFQVGALKAANLMYTYLMRLKTHERYDNTPLHAAISRGHYDNVRTLIDNGYNVNHTDSDQLTPLHYAAISRQCDITKLLLEHGADPSAHDAQGLTPLHTAMQVDHKHIAHVLLEHGATVDAKDSTGRTALHQVIRQEDLDSATYLLLLLMKYGASINAQDIYGATPLHLATLYGHTSQDNIPRYASRDLANKQDHTWSLMAQILLIWGARVDIIDNEGFTPYMIAGRDPDSVLYTLFSRYIATVQSSDIQPELPRFVPYDLGPLAQISLAQNGNNVNTWRIMEYAYNSSWGQDHKNIIEEHRVKTLIHAIDVHNFGVHNLKDIICHWVRENELIYEDDTWQTWLHIVAKKPHASDLIDGLIAIGKGDINAENDDEQTPLYVAAYHGNYQAVDTLLQHGADTDICDSIDQTPLHVATENDYVSLVNRIALYAELEACDQHEQTPLHYAARNGNPETIEILLRHGAMADQSDDHGRSPLDILLQTARNITFKDNRSLRTCELMLRIAQRMTTYQWDEDNNIVPNIDYTEIANALTAVTSIEERVEAISTFLRVYGNPVTSYTNGRGISQELINTYLSHDTACYVDIVRYALKLHQSHKHKLYALITEAWQHHRDKLSRHTPAQEYYDMWRVYMRLQNAMQRSNNQLKRSRTDQEYISFKRPKQ